MRGSSAERVEDTVESVHQILRRVISLFVDFDEIFPYSLELRMSDLG